MAAGAMNIFSGGNMNIELQGGPADGQRYEVTVDAETIDVPDYRKSETQYDNLGRELKCPAFPVYRYRKTERMTKGGLTIFEFIAGQ